jgi:RimJ/RimL family protein N-acetyltransferase
VATIFRSAYHQPMEERLGPSAFELQPRLEGALLKLRPLREDDFDALYAVARDPLIWEQHPHRDRWKEEVFRRDYFRSAIESHGALLVLDAQSGEVIGSSRYHGLDPERSEVEIGWTFLARRCWGGAYNGEMKRLMLEHAFRFVERVIFVIGENNWRSRKAVEKLGGVLLAGRSERGTDRVVYGLTADAHRR